MFIIASSLAPAIGLDLAAIWTRARDKAGMKQEALAAFMGIAPHQLADQLAGRGHLSLQRVLLIAQDEDGRRFLRYFALELAESSGMDLDALWMLAKVERVALRLIDKMQKRLPVKAELRACARKEIA